MHFLLIFSIYFSLQVIFWPSLCFVANLEWKLMIIKPTWRFSTNVHKSIDIFNFHNIYSISCKWSNKARNEMSRLWKSATYCNVKWFARLPDYQSTVQAPARISCWRAVWTAPKAAVNSKTFFIFLPSSSPASLLVSRLSACLRASCWLLSSPTSCSSLISITPSRSDSLSVSSSSSSCALTSPD